jgi:hypothetical protein
MLLLLFKNALWAAWWPYSTALLAMEKAACQRPTRMEPPPPPAPDTGHARPQESATATDALEPEFPASTR